MAEAQEQDGANQEDGPNDARGDGQPSADRRHQVSKVDEGSRPWFVVVGGRGSPSGTRLTSRDVQQAWVSVDVDADGHFDLAGGRGDVAPGSGLGTVELVEGGHGGIEHAG